ncbi:hypothetical protein D7U98_02300 [Stenotrophomonas maltophilia]|nr:hypothetical protein [Stenotrophomonas maltophilia]
MFARGCRVDCQSTALRPAWGNARATRDSRLTVDSTVHGPPRGQHAARRIFNPRKSSVIALLLPSANNGRNGACCRKSLHRRVQAGSRPAVHRLRAASR